MRTVLYRFFRTSWGIWIRLRAEAVISKDAPDRGFHAHGPFWIDLGTVVLPESEVRWLVRGVELVAPAITGRLAGRHVLIAVDALTFVLTDFQEEGLAVVIARWLAEEFDVPAPEIPARYDRGTNRYVFGWPS